MQIDRRARRKTPEEALRLAVEALGGLQEVGHYFKPEMSPEAAGQWLSHCLTASKRDKLSAAQEHLIWSRAFALGAHGGFEAYALSIGYMVTPVNTDALLVEAIKRAELARSAADDAARDLRSLIDNPRLFATMRAAGLKVEEVG